MGTNKRLATDAVVTLLGTLPSITTVVLVPSETHIRRFEYEQADLPVAWIWAGEESVEYHPSVMSKNEFALYIRVLGVSWISDDTLIDSVEKAIRDAFGSNIRLSETAIAISVKAVNNRQESYPMVGRDIASIISQSSSIQDV